MPIWICKQCGRSKPMVEFKRSKHGNYLEICAECSPSKFKPKLPNLPQPWKPGKVKHAYMPRFCDKCGYVAKRDGKKAGYRCRCRRDYDLDGNRKPLRKGIDRTQWFGLPKEKLAERMRWYQSATERKAASEIQDIAYTFNCPYKAQYVLCGYIVDFFYPKVKLVIEIDGPHHDVPEQAALDEKRQKHIQDAGFFVARVSYRDLDKHGAKYSLRHVRKIIESKLGNRLNKETE